ncbi:hypothetical protein ACJJTC_003073 [Scirpophaga incertulas]
MYCSSSTFKFNCLYSTVSESARVKISATRVDSKNERGEWRLWRAPRAVRSGWRPEARPGRAARPPSPRVTSSEQLRASPNLSDDPNVRAARERDSSRCWFLIRRFRSLSPSGRECLRGNTSLQLYYGLLTGWKRCGEKNGGPSLM